MGDIFKEQLVKRAKSKNDTMKKASIAIFAVAVSLLSFMALPTFAPFIVLAIGFGVYYSFTFFQVEYEYTLTNGTLDIDIIYNKARRKRIFSADLNEIEIMAHVDSGNIGPAMETLNYSSGVTTPNTYAFLINYKGKRTKVIIEPNDIMLQAFSSMLTPRRLIKRS